MRDLYPDLSEEQLKEAEANLERYIELTLRMFERIRSDPKAYAEFKVLTGLGPEPTMKTPGSNSS